MKDHADTDPDPQKCYGSGSDLAAAISEAVPVILGKYSEDPVDFDRIQSQPLRKTGSGSDLAAAISAAVPVILGK